MDLDSNIQNFVVGDSIDEHLMQSYNKLPHTTFLISVAQYLTARSCLILYSFDLWQLIRVDDGITAF